MTDVDLAVRFFLQLAVILLACRAVGWILRYLGQTQVVSEMIAGVCLGPSLLGLFFPDVQNWLFPATATVDGVQIRHPSMQILFVVSQIALVIYMFLVGLELDLGLLKTRKTGAVAVSVSGIITPFALGVLLAYAVQNRGDLFEANVPAWAGALYMGAAMAITAFPMLARIIYECGIARTSMGTLALSAAATDDALSWCILAIVLAVTKQAPTVAIFAIGGGIAYVLFLVLFLRKPLTFLSRWTDREGGLTPPIMVTTFAFVLAGAWYTDTIGIYAVFGAFIMGTVMPRGKFSELVQSKCEMVTTALLLPTFFVYSGLNTRVGLLNSVELWLLTGVIILVAITGKGVACTLAARATKEPWRESIMIGTLMNARGLIELIILNIGLQQKVITPTLFTIMVLMAIVTTVIASPLFSYLYRKSAAYKPVPSAAEAV